MSRRQREWRAYAYHLAITHQWTLEQAQALPNPELRAIAIELAEDRIQREVQAMESERANQTQKIN
tara:strand:+ start:670 stop:867 length:198 start_codon:yes stop_codon:yes gene_type:complete